jgi:hypothetical protein
MSRTTASSLLLLIVALVGCAPDNAAIANGDDPLQSLTVPVRSERYGTTYWTQNSVRDRELWAKATAYCEDKNDGDHPNCDVVRHVQELERASRLPEDRPNDFGLTVPQASKPNDEPQQP